MSNNEKEQADLDEGLDNGSGVSFDFNFVPEWVRRSPEQIHYADEDGRKRPERRGGKHPGRHESGGGHRRPDSGGRKPRRRKEAQDRPERLSRKEARGASERDLPRSSAAGGAKAYARRERPEIPDLPLRVSFIPEQRQLNVLVRQLVSSQRAYPLFQMPTVFIQKPDTCCAKLEIQEPGLELFRCRICGSVARTANELLNHLTQQHMHEVCEIEESKVEPPSGKFNCVARCGLSGEWIGPPNHHSYNERIEEIRSRRYPKMSAEDYRGKIETLHDEESIEAWKQSCTVCQVYRFLQPDGSRTEPLAWSAASIYFQEKLAPESMQAVKRAIVPLSICRNLEDVGLREFIRREWRYESRRPRSLLFALRVAFRHKRLHIFKVGHGHEFVSAVAPAPLDAKHTVEPIKSVLEFLREHPGCNRQQLLEGLRPGTELNDAGAAEVLKPLIWLRERGHIIEFFDGTLAEPLGVGKKGAKKAGAPAESKPPIAEGETNEKEA